MTQGFPHPLYQSGYEAGRKEAADEIDRLRTNIEVALQHALNHRKDNGCKADDQLGVIAVVLATTLEKIDRSAVRWHSTAALGEGK